MQIFTDELDLCVAGVVFVPDFVGHLVCFELLHPSGAGRHQDQDVVVLAKIQDKAVRLVQRAGSNRHLGVKYK